VDLFECVTDDGGVNFPEFSRWPGFVDGSHDAALKFSANIGKWQIKGLDLGRFGKAGGMIEFKVMIRPIKALAALGEEKWEPHRPQLTAC
jgi:hypothetical protein